MAVDTVFYDGDCGLCHRTVRFLLSADRDGRLFRFAPIGGETFLSSIGASQRTELPDSLVVLADDGRLLIRSDATVHILRRLGNPWRTVGSLIALVPRVVRDGLYDFIARIRHRLFSAPEAACPVPSPGARARFAP